MEVALRKMSMDHWRKDIDREKSNYGGGPCSGGKFSSTKFTRTGLRQRELHPGPEQTLNPEVEEGLLFYQMHPDPGNVPRLEPFVLPLRTTRR